MTLISAHVPLELTRKINQISLRSGKYKREKSRVRLTHEWNKIKLMSKVFVELMS